MSRLIAAQFVIPTRWLFMPLPTPPTMLLAAAGLAMVSGRYLHFRFNGIWGTYYVVAILVAAYGLWSDPIATPGAIGGLDIRRVWINDPLAISEQWLVLAFGLLSGVALFDSTLGARDSFCRYGFLLFVISGLMLVARSNDFLSLGMSLEIVSLATIALQRFSDSPREATTSHHAATSDLESPRAVSTWFGWLASGWMWFGIALLSNALATTQFDASQLVLIETYDPGGGQLAIGTPSKFVLLAVGLITLSLFARMGLVPFHFGFGVSPQSRSIPSSGFAMLVGQLAGSVALTRLCGCVFVGLGQPLTVLMIVVCLATFSFAGVMAVRSLAPGVRSIQRWLTCLMLLQSAWLGVGLMIATNELDHPDARWGAFPEQNETLGLIVFSQFAGFLSCGGIYWILGHLARVDRGVEFLEDVKGLGQFAPSASFALIVSLASSIGCPWTAGGWGRWLLALAGHNVHIKSTSSFLLPHAGLRLAILMGTIATVLIAGIVVRLIREIVLEPPLARPIAIGGRGPLIAGMIATFASLLVGVAPQLVLRPLRSIEVPRESTPEIPQRGSGKNHSAFRAGFEHLIEFSESSCQARCTRQVSNHFLIRTKLACCSWQSSNGWAQFCPVWSGTSSPGHQPREDNPFILVDSNS